MLTFATEEWFDVLPEMQKLWSAHWDEVARDKDKIKLDPDFEAYAALASAGQIHVTAAREDGKLVGYLVAFVRPHLHYRQSLSAFFDLYYLVPYCRKGMNGVSLFIAAEKALKRRGVQKLFSGTKKSLDMSRIFEWLGWTETEILHTKVI